MANLIRPLVASLSNANIEQRRPLSKTAIMRYPDSLNSISDADAGADNAWATIMSTVLGCRDGRCWNKDVYEEVYRGLSEHLTSNDTCVTENVLYHFLLGLQTYNQLAPSLDILRYGGIDQVTRTRMYRLPLYASLTERCFSVFGRCLLTIASAALGKDYASQTTLRPIIEALRKIGFSMLASSPNIGLRNAISHGTVNLRRSGTKVAFSYLENSERRQENVTFGYLDKEIYGLFDALSSFILAFSVVLYERGVVEQVDFTGDPYTKAMLNGLCISDDACVCIDAFEAGALANQINYCFKVSNTDTDYVFDKAGKLLMGLYQLMPEYDQYSISFDNERLIKNYIRATNEEISHAIQHGLSSSQLVSMVIKRGDILWCKASTENVDMQQIRFFRFPFLERDSLRIYDVEDVSLEDRKRIKANGFIGSVSDKNEILSLLNTAIAWLKDLTNPPSPCLKIKHGTMEADCVYINVYRDDLRGSRELTDKNDNFVCQVEYCPDTSFRLKDSNNFIQYLYRNSEEHGPVRILWRDRKYLTVVNDSRVRRNDPCPCGSGLKYKKCCGRSEP